MWASDDDPAGPIDWALAASVAGRLAPPGPTADRAELVALVGGLRDAAARAPDEVAAVTGLRPAAGHEPTPVLVVDRPGWARANTASLAILTRPLTGERVSAAARASAGLQVGGVLALLAGRVLGQFDPFTGRLVLVAPNVLEVQRRLEVDPGDFRLWVALHEQTHALQFAAAPWLVGHLRDTIGGLLADLGPERVLGEDVGVVARTLAGRDGAGLLDLLDPPQRAVFDEVSAVMALLEGHADVAMDEVGPAVVPSVATIRARFDARRTGSKTTGVAGLARRLLGMDLKMAQYRDGAVFVRAVRRRVGREAFNAVWTSPTTLPTPAEIADPAAWVARVRP
jgi:coenzyme F420 biosynthesis associated uncharacterized protein